MQQAKPIASQQTRHWYGRTDWQVNHKRVRGLMDEMGVFQKRKRRKVRTTNSQHSFVRYLNRVQSLEISQPDQGWVADNI